MNGFAVNTVTYTIVFIRIKNYQQSIFATYLFILCKENAVDGAENDMKMKDPL